MKEKRKEYKNIIFIVLIIICAIAFVTSGFVLGKYYYGAYKTKTQLNDLSDLHKSGEKYVEKTVKGKKNKKGKKKKEVKKVVDFSALLKQNEDIIGWIQIPDSPIDYPIMYTEKDDKYYLHRNFKKQYDANGLPYIKKGSNLNEHKGNTIVYGHHMRSGMMFAELLKYKEEKYYKKHQTVYVDLMKECRTYKVVGAFYSRVYKKKEKAVKYYNYFGNLDKKQFKEYKKLIEDNALYKTGEKLTYGDNLISLVTCSYHTNNGRFVVVAKQVK